MPKLVTLSLRLPKPVHTLLRGQAVLEHRSLNSLIVDMLYDNRYECLRSTLPEDRTVRRVLAGDAT